MRVNLSESNRAGVVAFVRRQGIGDRPGTVGRMLLVEIRGRHGAGAKCELRRVDHECELTCPGQGKRALYASAVRFARGIQRLDQEQREESTS